MIIGISGKGRSGKDTFSQMLLEELGALGEKYITMAYSDNLKLRMVEDFGLSFEQVYGDLKEVPDERYPKADGGYWTPREILQYMGTEGFRHIEPGFWVRQLFDSLEIGNIKNVVITDCRFPDEVDIVLEKGGIHIRVEREDKDYITDTEHTSEISLDDYEVVYCVVENNTTLEDLNESAKLIADEIIRLEKTKLELEIGGN